jgi:hypothetical protein
MLRHRFRQKIGMETELSLENFIEDLLIDKTDMMRNGTQTTTI